MRIDDNLAVTFQIGERHIYHTPISRETFEANYRLIAATKAVLFDTTDQALVLDGPILASLVLRDEGRQLAKRRGEDGDSGAQSLLDEIERLTMAIGPDLDLIPVSTSGVDQDEWQEALSRLVFFTVNYALAPKIEKARRAASVCAILHFEPISLSAEAWKASLRTSTKPATTAKKAASSVPV